MWDHLPDLILIEIFSYLSRVDRSNVGKVCRTWNRALSSPVLWRSVTILIDRDLRADISLAGKLAVRYGQHMRRLELAWSRPYFLPSREPRLARNSQAEAGADYLALVKGKEIQLKELALTDWIFSCKWAKRGKLLSALANFLACQHRLEVLSFLNANFGASDVLRLLGSACKGCAERLASLDLRGAFREWQIPHNNPKYLRIFGEFRALTTLKIDYPALSDRVLNSLANGAPKILKTLHICVRDSDSRQHIVADNSWHKLVLACPRLIVAYTIVNISHYEDMCYLLLPSIPLAKFHMFSGYVWDQSRTRNFRGTIALLIAHYTETLAEVMLQLRNNRELLDDLVVSMLVRCKSLSRFQFDGILRNLETLRDICQLQMDRKIQFRTIHVKPRNVNAENRVTLNDINYRYDRKFLERGVHFRIEDSPSVLVFY